MASPISEHEIYRTHHIRTNPRTNQPEIFKKTPLIRVQTRREPEKINVVAIIKEGAVINEAGEPFDFETWPGGEKAFYDHLRKTHQTHELHVCGYRIPAEEGDIVIDVKGRPRDMRKIVGYKCPMTGKILTIQEWGLHKARMKRRGDWSDAWEVVDHGIYENTEESKEIEAKETQQEKEKRKPGRPPKKQEPDNTELQNA